MITDILIFGNVLLGVFLAILSFKFYTHTKEPWRWTKFLYGIDGILWAISYLYIGYIRLFSSVSCEFHATIGEMIIRPLGFITLASMLAGAIVRIRTK